MSSDDKDAAFPKITLLLLMGPWPDLLLLPQVAPSTMRLRIAIKSYTWFDKAALQVHKIAHL